MCRGSWKLVVSPEAPASPAKANGIGSGDPTHERRIPRPALFRVFRVFRGSRIFEGRRGGSPTWPLSSQPINSLTALTTTTPYTTVVNAFSLTDRFIHTPATVPRKTAGASHNADSPTSTVSSPVPM